MSSLEVHPAYRPLFRSLGLASAADFLRLEGEILGGHPDRHVLRLTLGASARSTSVHALARQRRASVTSVAASRAAGGVDEQVAFSTATVTLERSHPDDRDPAEQSPNGWASAAGLGKPAYVTGRVVAAFLKKEHRVAWRDRLAHAWLGFGWVSKSTREGRMLRQVEQAGIGCPQALVWGEHEGRAFLLVREATGLVDLRVYLQQHPGERRALAAALGREVARIHAAGFFHRDLSSKHVLVGRAEHGYRFCFLDWQRARHGSRIGWRQRLVDLAMLDATLASAWASPRDRLIGWNAYLSAAQANGAAGRSLSRKRPRRWLHVVCRLSAALQRKRRIRELRQPPLPTGAQNLIWLDGEGLCVTRQFLEEVKRPPAWLQTPSVSPGNRLEVLTIPASRGRSWRLLRRWSSRPGQWLWSWWRRPLFPAPEFEHAAALIRLERYGLEVPRLLALGRRRGRPWQTFSFLLVEPPRDTVPLHYHLRQADGGERRRLLRAAGRLLGRIHQAGYAWRGQAWRGHGLACLAVRPSTGALVLTGVEGLQRSQGDAARLARRDFAKLLRASLPGLSAADRLRFALGCLGQEKLTTASRRMLRRLLKAWRRAEGRLAWLERRVV